MKALTGIVAAAALSLAAGAKADEQSEGRLGALATEADEQQDERLVTHGDVSYSVGYIWGLELMESGSLQGFEISAHFVPYRFSEGLNLGINAEASMHAFLNGNPDLMFQQKVAIGLDAPTDIVEIFPYVGLGFAEITPENAYFSFCQGLGLNFGTNEEVTPYFGLEHGWLFDGENQAEYATLNFGLKLI